MFFLDKTGLEQLWQHIILKLGDKVDKDFLAYIRDYKNLNVNVVKEVGEMKEYNITFCYSGVNYQVPYGKDGEELEINHKYFAGQKEANFKVPFGQHYKDKQKSEVDSGRRKALGRVRLAPITFGICLPIVVIFWIMALTIASSIDPSKMTSHASMIMEGGFVASFFIAIAGLAFTIRSVKARKRIEKVANDLKNQIDNQVDITTYNLHSIGGYSRLSAIANVISVIISIVVFIVIKSI